MNGIVLLGPDKAIEKQAAARKVPLRMGEMGEGTSPLPFGKTLFVASGTTVPWDLLPAAWHFLERWDAAVPLWRYGVNAGDVGSKEERHRTQAIVRDLRVLLHSVELLFVRDNEDGRALVEAYRRELADSQERRLAFLRAVYQVKPRLCVLPRSWLADVDQRSKQDARAPAVVRRRMGTAPALVKVEVMPGRYVRCRAGDEDRVRERFEKLGRPRHERERR